MHIDKGNEIELDFGLAELEKAAEFLKVFSDPTRMKMMAAMYKRERPVCDIAKAAALSHSLASHQLAVMKKYKLVKAERRGKHVFYRLADDCVEQILTVAVNHIREFGE